LYSEVAEQPNGVPLTVLSALARYGLDPWNEADRLARLPATIAVEILTEQLTPALAFDTQSNIKSRARRLIRLLPVPKADKAVPDVVTPEERQSGIIYWGIIGIIAGSVALAGLYLTTGNIASTAPSAWIGVNPSHASASPQSGSAPPRPFAERIPTGSATPPPSVPSRP
jgi:hypothetical protein